MAVLASGATLAQSAENAKTPNVWLEGEAARESDEVSPPKTAPREKGAKDEILDVPQAPKDFDKVLSESLNPQATPSDIFSFESVRDQKELLRYGAITLEESLQDVAGLWFYGRETQSPLAQIRGRSNTEHSLTLDGIPLNITETYPDFPLLSLFAPDDFSQVRVNKGPRFSPGTALGSSGSIDLFSRASQNDTQGVALAGQARGGLGGGDADRFAHVYLSTGIGQARLSASLHLHDRGERRSGREADLLEGSGGVKSSLLARADVPTGLANLYGTVAGARQYRSVVSTQCLQRADSRIFDCATADERGYELISLGAQKSLGTFDFDLKTHIQRAGTEYLRSGRRVLRTERTLDDNWRMGAIASAQTGFSLGPFAFLSNNSAEVLRDRTKSLAFERSRITVDGDPIGDGRLQDARTRRTSASKSELIKARSELLVAWKQTRARVVVSAGAQSRSAPAKENRHDAFEQAKPFFEGSLSLSQPLPARSRVFATLSHHERPASLYAATRGREDFSDGFNALAFDQGARFANVAEIGIESVHRAFEIKGVLYSALSSGQIGLFTNVQEGEEGETTFSESFVQRDDELSAGFEIEARARAGNSLSAQASLAAAFIEEGDIFNGLSSPASRVVPPRATLALHYTPTIVPLDLYVRTRALFPQARISPVESFDAELCPERSGENLNGDCRGAEFAAFLDMGLAFEITQSIKLDAALYNLLDQSARQHGQPLPASGIGARILLVLTL